MHYRNYTLTLKPRVAAGYPCVAQDEDGAPATALAAPPDEAVQRSVAAFFGGERRPQELRTSGAALFRFLFTPALESHLRAAWMQAAQAGDGLRLRLTVETDEFISWPWELLHDPVRGHTFATSPATPFIRFIPNAMPLPLPPVGPPVDALLVLPYAPDLDLAAERRNLTDVASALGDALALRVLEGVVTRADLADALLTGDVEILHFAGHGAWAEGAGYIALNRPNRDEDWLDEEHLARLIGTFPTLRLVILNACNTGQNAHAQAFQGIAPGLVRAGAPAVIAMQHAIGDVAAVTFTREFYKRLLVGEDAGRVDVALTHARAMLSVLHADGSWTCPALYTAADDANIATTPAQGATFDPIARRARLAALGASLAASRACEEDWVLTDPIELRLWQARLRDAAAAYRKRLEAPIDEARAVAGTGLAHIESRLEAIEHALATTLAG